jgi:hypothetical protein
VATYSISGTISYTGSLTSVTAGHPIYVLCSTSPLNSSFPQNMAAYAVVPTNGGAYSFAVPTAGTYYVAAFVGLINTPA